MKRFATLILGSLVSVACSEAANIAFVSFHADDNVPSAAAVTAGFTQAPDAGYTQLLRDNGHTVTRIVTSATPVAAALNAFDVVIISRSVPSGNYQSAASTAAWNGITAPTIIMGGYILRNSRLGYTTGGTIPDTTGTVGLKVMVPGHPVFAGIPLNADGKMANAYANIVSYTNTVQRGISVNSNPVSGGGVVLAAIGTIGDAAQGGMVIGEWMAGDKMANGTADALAGHRLVVLTGSRENAAGGGAGALTAEAAGIYDLAADGATILLNAVNYMASSRASIVTVNTADNEFPGAGETSLAQALGNLQDGDTVRFQIPGADPHVIATPLGGYPLITANSINIDGYTQAGAVPNSNAILGGNNAQIKIVLDSTSAATAGNDPQDPSLNARHSTRILHSGYGDSENGILAFLGSDNITVRGLSFIGRRASGTTDDPSIYAVALVNGATNARVQGCWFGLAPGGSTQDDLKPVAAAVAAFRFNNGDGSFTYSSGAVVGTDGDGVVDRTEFNIIVGGRIPIALELPGARISGNYVNVFPNGLTFVDIDDNYAKWGEVLEAAGEPRDDVSIENYENGRFTEGTVIGTNGDGVSDSDERNIFGHTVYDTHGEFYSSSANAVLAGNYFGVGVDGTTLAPQSTNVQADFVEFGGGSSQVRIGSNGDGVSDDIEGNLIVGVKGGSFFLGNGTTPIVASRNKLVDCGFSGVPFAAGDRDASYYAPFMADAALGITPILKPIVGGMLNATIPAPSAGYPNTVLDVYVVDQAALAKNNFWPAPLVHPMTFVGSFTDNGPGDSNPNANEFTIDVSALGLSPTTYVAAAASYSSVAGNFNAINAVTTPMSNPTSELPVLVQRMIEVDGFIETVELSWLSAPESYDAQLNNNVADANNWGPFPTTSRSHVGGRNVITTEFDFFTESVFFRLISK